MPVPTQLETMSCRSYTSTADFRRPSATATPCNNKGRISTAPPTDGFLARCLLLCSRLGSRASCFEDICSGSGVLVSSPFILIGFEFQLGWSSPALCTPPFPRFSFTSLGCLGGANIASASLGLLASSVPVFFSDEKIFFSNEEQVARCSSLGWLFVAPTRSWSRQPPHGYNFQLQCQFQSMVVLFLLYSAALRGALLHPCKRSLAHSLDCHDRGLCVVSRFRDLISEFRIQGLLAHALGGCVSFSSARAVLCTVYCASTARAAINVYRTVLFTSLASLQIHPFYDEVVIIIYG